MIAYTFTVNGKEYNRKFLTLIQHKLRVLMKCYTIQNFSLNPENQTFSFKKTNRINKLVMNDSKEYSGIYLVEENADLDEVKITIKV